jgi:hypothetical protein
MAVVTNSKLGAKPSNAYILSAWAVPVGIAQSGTVAVAGTITFTNALPTTYAGIWLYFPSTAMNPATAGFYYCTNISGNQYQVTTAYEAAPFSKVPYVPAGYSNAVGSNSAYTGVVTEQVLATFTVPGGSIGASGAIRGDVLWANNNSAGTKTPKVTFGGSIVTYTTTVALRMAPLIRNAGVVSSQIIQSPTSSGSGVHGTFTAVAGRLAINTALDQNITLTGQLATATDYLILDAATFEILPG